MCELSPGPSGSFHLQIVAMASVRVLVSFYLMPELGKVKGQPICKEKFNLPIKTEGHKELLKFKNHFENFTSFSKSREVKVWEQIVRINKVASVSFNFNYYK